MAKKEKSAKGTTGDFVGNEGKTVTLEGKAPENPAENSTGTIKAQVIKAAVVIPEVEEKHSVWMGVVEDCPFTTVHAGGRDFSLETEKVWKDEDDQATKREKQVGKLVPLTTREIDFISKAVGKKVIRKIGAKAYILNVDDPRYRANGVDQPLASFVYMQIVSGGSMNYDWRNSTPSTMA